MSEGPPYKKRNDKVFTIEELSGMMVDLTGKTEKLVEWTKPEDVIHQDIEDQLPKTGDVRNAIRLKPVDEQVSSILKMNDDIDEDNSESIEESIKKNLDRRDQIVGEAVEKQMSLEEKKNVFLTKLKAEIDEMLQKGVITDEVAESRLASADLIEKKLAETEEGLVWQARMFAHAGYLTLEETVNLLNEDPESPKKPEQETSIESEESVTLDAESATVEEQPNNKSLLPTSVDAFARILPEAERDTSMVEAFKAGIAAAATFEELIATIETVDNIEGTLGFYSSQQVVELIEMVIRGEQTAFVITRNAGIRKKVLELLAESVAPETSPVTPPPLPKQPESIHSKEDQEKFERLQSEFFEKQHAYFDAFRDHLNEDKKRTLIKKIKSKFSGAETQQSAEERYSEAAILFKDAYKKYTPVLFARRVREAYAELTGKVCFSDLPDKLQKVVNQMAIDEGRNGYGVADSVPDNVIVQLQRAGMISESEVSELQSKTEHPQVEQKLRLSIWNNTHIAERDTLVEIAAEAFPLKDLIIIKKSMWAFTGKNPTTVSGLFMNEKNNPTF